MLYGELRDGEAMVGNVEMVLVVGCLELEGV
jgi:hypothetical protein